MSGIESDIVPEHLEVNVEWKNAKPWPIIDMDKVKY
jgi:hypothetical protein